MPPPDEPPPAETVRFYYVKSTAFRVVHADGVFGGPTPKGLVHITFWNERYPIPQQIEQKIAKQDGTVITLGEEVTRVAKPGLVREAEVGVVMTLETARSFRDWLSRHIEKLEEESETTSDAKVEP